MQNLTLKLFNSAIKHDAGLKAFDQINSESMKYGYIVHPDACTLEVLNWIKSNHRNVNTTFYKKWNDITSKTRFELLIDQVRHYASTYGTNFQGEVWTPDADVAVETIDFSIFKTITALTEAEVRQRCANMLYSGAALAEETLNDLLRLLDHLKGEVDINLVKNREAMMFLCDKCDVLPAEPVEMVRYLVYKATGKTLLIKDKATIEALEKSSPNVSNLILKYGVDKLSSVFYRFKPLFLAMRNNWVNRSVVNKLRRAAERNHKPMKIGYFENLLSVGKFEVRELELRLQGITNFKKITLLQALKKRLKGIETSVYVIRNQKVWVKEKNDSKVIVSFEHCTRLYSLIYASLVDSLKKKATTVALPDGINITAPKSAKSFIGNYPIGSSIDFSDSDNIFGINWRGEDGASDLDLSILDIDGVKLGWNSHFTNDNNSLVYSGDMTSARPEATELFYAKKQFRPGIACVNLYSGQENSKFRFFVAREKINSMQRNYMVNPNNIVVSVDAVMDSKQKMLGVIADNKFVLTILRTGKGSVSSGGSVSSKITEYTLDTLDCYVSLKQLLIDAGYTVTNDKPQIDLRNLAKDTLIDLLS